MGVAPGRADLELIYGARAGRGQAGTRRRRELAARSKPRLSSVVAPTSGATADQSVAATTPPNIGAPSKVPRLARDAGQRHHPGGEPGGAKADAALVDQEGWQQAEHRDAHQAHAAKPTRQQYRTTKPMPQQPRPRTGGWVRCWWVGRDRSSHRCRGEQRQRAGQGEPAAPANRLRQRAARRSTNRAAGIAAAQTSTTMGQEVWVRATPPPPTGPHHLPPTSRTRATSSVWTVIRASYRSAGLVRRLVTDRARPVTVTTGRPTRAPPPGHRHTAHPTRPGGSRPPRRAAGLRRRLATLLRPARLPDRQRGRLPFAIRDLLGTRLRRPPRPRNLTGLHGRSSTAEFRPPASLGSCRIAPRVGGWRASVGARGRPGWRRRARRRR